MQFWSHFTIIIKNKKWFPFVLVGFSEKQAYLGKKDSLESTLLAGEEHPTGWSRDVPQGSSQEMCYPASDY